MAIQSLLKAGFRRALHVEGVVIMPYLVIRLAEFHYFLRLAPQQSRIHTPLTDPDSKPLRGLR